MRIVTGPFHPSLEGALLADLGAIKKRDPLAPVTIVAPSARLARHLAAAVAKHFPSGVAAVRFHNLTSFARSIDDEFPADERLIDDDFLLERLIVEIIARDFRDRPYLQRALRIPGTARALLGALQELREGVVDPADALDAMKEREIGAGEDSVKLGELLSLHYLFAKELRDRKWRDRADLIVRAAELVPKSRIVASQKAILYYGAYELVQAQLDVLKAVGRAADVTIYMPYTDSPEYAYAYDFTTTVISGDRVKLARMPSAPARRVLSASGARDEAWAAAKEVLRLHDLGIAFHEIGVIARTLEPYADAVETLFPENQIPFVSSAHVRDSVDRAISLITVADDDFPRDVVLRLIEGDDLSSWDLVTRDLGIGHGRATWERRLYPQAGKERSIKRGGRDEQAGVLVSAKSMTDLANAVRSLLARTTGPETGSWSEHSAWARGLIGDRPELQTLADLDGITPAPSGREFRVTLRDRLRRATRRIGGDNIRGVQMLDAMSARGIGFRAVILLGLNERIWPRVIREDGFLTDGVRSQMTHRLGNRLTTKSAGYEEERLLFELATSCATDELVLVWQRSDEEGRVQVRSSFLAEAGEQVPRRPGAKFEWTSALTPKELSVRATLRAPAPAIPKAFGWDVASWNASFEFQDAIENDRKAGIRDGIVGPPTAWWAKISARGFSPTSIESFARCPFQFFASRLLRLAQLDEPETEGEIDNMQAGAFYHRVLELFYKRHRGERARLDAGFTEAVREFEEEHGVRYPLAWEAAQSRMRAVIDAFLAKDLARDDGFVPTYFEQELAGTLGFPVGRHGDVRFLGYADRIDVRADGAFRVIDYKKSGGSYQGSVANRALQGKLLQPPVYFLLAERLLRDAGRKPLVAASSSGYAFLEEHLEPDAATEAGIRGDFWEQRDTFAQSLAGHLDAIADGRFLVDPGNHCRYCDIATACRKSHAPTRWRADRAREDKR